MARDPVVAGSHRPSAIAPATPAIAHVQLRDLLICPRETGVVNYVVPHGIVEQDLHAPGAPVRTLAKLGFTPNCLTSLQLGADDYLIAAGGQEKEIHLSYHAPPSSKSRSNSETQRKTRVVWEFEDHLTGSINNSVLLTSLNLTRSNESGVEPRVGISNNDGTVRLYDVPLRVQNSRRRLKEVGVIELDVPINHSSISPDGRTLLSVGDSNKVYFHQISGGSRISFTPITNLIIPPPDTTSYNYTSSPSYSSTSLTAAFSTAFSGDGSKFAVASQEGVVAVWDVRSTRPLKVFHTDRSRETNTPGLVGNGGASGWLSDDPWEWTRGTKAPGWCVRSVKFNGGEGGRFGREVMAFTEHTSLVHLVDARTFEIHDIIRVPTLQRPKPKLRAPSVTTSTATSNTRSTSSRRVIPSSSTAAGSSTGEGANLQRHRTLIRRGVPPTSHTQLTRTGSTSHIRGEPRGGWNSLDWRGILDPPDTSPSTPPSPPLPSRASDVRGVGPRRYFATRYATRGGPPRRSEAAATFVAGINTLAEPRVTPRARSESPTQQTRTPGIVQALGDTFRIPGVGVSPSSPPRPTSSGSGTYSPPASIGDSTWRTLGGGAGPSTTTIARPATPPWARLVDLASEHAEENQNQNHDRDDDDDDGMTVDDYDARMNMVLPDHDWELPTARHRLNFAGDDLDESMFVVPDLGDRGVESDVHALLAVHGIPSRSPEGSAGGSNGSGGDEADEGYRSYADMDRFMYNYFDTELGHPVSRGAVGAEYSSSHQEEPQEESDGMDVDGDERHHDEEGDEEEEDTESPSDEDSSRVGSPANASRRIRSSGSPSWQLASPTSRGHTPTPSDNKPLHSSLTSSRGNMSTRKYGYYDGLDIAGMCFDPWGERMYVAGVGIGIGSPGRLVGMRGSLVSGEGVGMGAVVEWGVNGAEKRWFVDDGWR